MKETNLLKIIYSYRVFVDQDGLERPIFEVVSILDHKGQTLTEQIQYNLLEQSSSERRTFKFEDIELLKSYFIDNAETLKVSKIYFLNIFDLNYALENSSDISDLAKYWQQYSSVWEKQNYISKDKFSLKDFFSGPTA
ncbi:MAG: hypothetical protein JNM93_07885 [Bacteriovoracaceae bacterium]|nr:hypothetical protein [Bacteriovoracaceae bacterium]